MTDQRSTSLTFVPLGMRIKVAAEYLGLSESAFREKVKLGEIAKPRKISERCKVWDSRELMEYFSEVPHEDEDDANDPWG